MCHTYSDMGPPFFKFISKRPMILTSECRALCDGAITTYFKRLRFDAAGMSGAQTHYLPDAMREHYHSVAASSFPVALGQKKNHVCLLSLAGKNRVGRSGLFIYFFFILQFSEFGFLELIFVIFLYFLIVLNTISTVIDDIPFGLRKTTFPRYCISVFFGGNLIFSFFATIFNSRKVKHVEILFVIVCHKKALYIVLNRKKLLP